MLNTSHENHPILLTVFLNIHVKDIYFRKNKFITSYLIKCLGNAVHINNLNM